MTIFVGSHNPVKVNAIVNAASETWPDVTVEGIDVPSGISEQPFSDKETRVGAVNRAEGALAQGLKIQPALQKTPELVLGVGLEGGVFEHDGDVWSTVWVAVIDLNGSLFEANGARFKVPPRIGQLLKDGQELGPLMSELVGEADIRKKQGMIGIITNSFVDRTEQYQGIAKMAIGLWHGREWDKKLNLSTQKETDPLLL